MTHILYRSTANPTVPLATSVSTQALTYAELDGNFKSLVDGKQEVLVSGTSIKTVNGATILGTGDITLGTLSSQNSTAVSITGGDVQNVKLKSYTEALTTVTVSTATYDIDLSLGNMFDITLNANSLFTFTNPPAAGTLRSVTIILRQGTGGSKLATFTNAKYTDGVLPILSTPAGQIDVLSFFTVNGGSFWFGTFAMANVS